MKIKELFLDERPRERLLQNGAECLSNVELLAILLRTGTREKNVLELARTLLEDTEGKIGGRYVLIGGELASPLYLYGEDPREFIPISEEQARQDGFYRESEHEGIKYREWSFI